MINENKKKILVIEDEEPLLSAIKKKLGFEGFLVNVVRSVDQALVSLKRNYNFDLIWLDHYLLGKKNGINLVAEIKENEELRNIPIFVVSNTATPDKIKTYKELGVDKYYTKSDHSLKEIVEDIKNFLNIK